MVPPRLRGLYDSKTLGEDGTVLATFGYPNPTFLWIPAQANGATGTAYPIAGLPDQFVSADMNRRRDFVGSTRYGGDDNSRAYRVSNEGQVVEDLNTLIPANSGWVLQDAYGINDAGYITGTGYFTDAAGVEEHGLFLLVPTAY
ncbi:MAG: hypothetical protein H7Y38_07380 [Armatimonadetes bacterium]|nr:hypothetical protein [Armatimonadota bacterium]